MKRRLAIWLLGFWAMGTAAVTVAATQNFSLVDQLLRDVPNPAFASIVDDLGSPVSRDLLRYLVSEINRSFFEIWGWVQLPLGGLVLWLVWERGRRVRYGAIAMLGAAVVLAVGLTPPIVEIGRALDFVPRDPAPPALSTFGLFHAAYTIAEFGKLCLGLTMAFWLIKD